MKKITTLLVRDPDDRAHVLEQVTEGCEWVLAGEGVATRKYDGTCTMLDDGGNWWARREVKRGGPEPANFAASDFDEVTGKTQGWEPIAQSPFAKFHAEALLNADATLDPGTYELIGPKVNGNPEGVLGHRLIRHTDATRIEGFVAHSIAEIKGLVAGVAALGYEGIVWHHPDGRMAKLKVCDLR